MEKQTELIVGLFVLGVVLLSILTMFSMKSNIDSSTNITSSTSEGEKILGYVKDYSDLDLSSSWDDSDVYEIVLNGDKITADANIEVQGTTVYIKDGGTYLISGTLNDGQIIVYSEDAQSVRLILNGVNISSSTDAPITILNAEETIITLAEGSINYLTDTGDLGNTSEDEDATTAAIYSKDDLYINGNGTLIINSENKNGIQSKDQLIILDGTININAAKEAIKAKDYIVIENGTFNLVSGEDGIRTTEDEDEEKGFIYIYDGTFNLVSVRDGIQAETSLIIGDGNFDITTVSNDDSESSKGLKAGEYLEINNAIIEIESTDDGIHSDGEVIINSGDIVISSGDDGVHAESLLEINGGSINIEKSYEGLESSLMYINEGNISIVSSDDGINIAGAGGGMTMTAVDGEELYINGGNLYVNANGDGLDSNGDMYINGGTIVVDGPTNSGNGGLDCNGELIVTGGNLIVVGSAGMAETPDQTSGQNSISITFTETQQAGTKVEIKSEDGEIIFSKTSAKIFQSFIASSEDITQGETYQIYVDDELYQEFTATSVVTQIGTASNMGMGGGMGGRGFW